MFDWRSWCQLCGNCEVCTSVAEAEMERFVSESFGISLGNSQICIDCSAYIDDIQHFLARASDIRKMFDHIESSDETKTTPDFLMNIRLSYKLAVPDIVIEYEENERGFGAGNAVGDIDNYDFVEDEEPHTYTETNDNPDNPMIPILEEEDMFETEEPEFLFDIPNTTTDTMSDTTLIEQTSSSQMLNKSATAMKRFKCEECGKLFREDRQRQVHKQTHLPNDLKLIHQCPHCDKKYSSIFTVRNHIKHVHMKVAEFRCELCNKDFSRKANYDSHMSHVHTRDRRFECEICGLKVKTKGILRTHKLLHSNNPADIKRCPQCPKKFKTQNQLINHIKRHPKMKEKILKVAKV